MPLPLVLIDAFADGPFTGNPAAVTLLDSTRSDAWMQSLAMEMNQAETAFLQQRTDGYSLRWFTPLVEVDLCGHATLASAHFLWETGHLPPTSMAQFHSRSGLLTATRDTDGRITLDFPAIKSQVIPAPPNLEAALGTRPEVVLRGDYDLICVLPSAEAVRQLRPDLAAIARIDARGVLATARGEDGTFDIVSRCFYPVLGVPEDPVTGSAHCALATYWMSVLGKSQLLARQASRRGGTLECRVAGARVHLTGRAVTTVRGELSG